MSKAATFVIALAIGLAGIGTATALAAEQHSATQVAAAAPADCPTDMHWSTC